MLRSSKRARPAPLAQGREGLGAATAAGEAPSKAPRASSDAAGSQNAVRDSLHFATVMVFLHNFAGILAIERISSSATDLERVIREGIPDEKSSRLVRIIAALLKALSPSSWANPNDASVIASIQREYARQQHSLPKEISQPSPPAQRLEGAAEGDACAPAPGSTLAAGGTPVGLGATSPATRLQIVHDLCSFQLVDLAKFTSLARYVDMNVEWRLEPVLVAAKSQRQQPPKAAAGKKGAAGGREVGAREAYWLVADHVLFCERGRQWQCMAFSLPSWEAFLAESAPARGRTAEERQLMGTLKKAYAATIQPLLAANEAKELAAERRRIADENRQFLLDSRKRSSRIVAKELIRQETIAEEESARRARAEEERLHRLAHPHLYMRASSRLPAGGLHGQSRGRTERGAAHGRGGKGGASAATTPWMSREDRAELRRKRAERIDDERVLEALQVSFNESLDQRSADQIDIEEDSSSDHSGGESGSRYGYDGSSDEDAREGTDSPDNQLVPPKSPIRIVVKLGPTGGPIASHSILDEEAIERRSPSDEDGTCSSKSCGASQGSHRLPISPLQAATPYCLTGDGGAAERQPFAFERRPDDGDQCIAQQSTSSRALDGAQTCASERIEDGSAGEQPCIQGAEPEAPGPGPDEAQPRAGVKDLPSRPLEAAPASIASVMRPDASASGSGAGLDP